MFVLSLLLIAAAVAEEIPAVVVQQNKAGMLNNKQEISCDPFPPDSMPSCQTYCLECNDAATGANAAAGTLGTIRTALDLMVDLSPTDSGILACSGQINSVIASAGGQIAQCQNNPEDCDWLTAENFANVACTILSCTGVATGPIGVAAGLACSFGGIVAQLITCLNFDDYCRDEIINSQPVEPEMCCFCTKQTWEDGYLWDTLLNEEEWGSVAGSPEECSRFENRRVDDAIQSNVYYTWTDCTWTDRPDGTICWGGPGSTPDPIPTELPTTTDEPTTTTTDEPTTTTTDDPYPTTTDDPYPTTTDDPYPTTTDEPYPPY